MFTAPACPGASQSFEQIVPGKLSSFSQVGQDHIRLSPQAERNSASYRQQINPLQGTLDALRLTQRCWGCALQCGRSLDRQTAAIRLMDLGVLDPSLSTADILMINKEPVIHDSLPFRGALLDSSLTSFINQAQPSLPPSHITRYSLKFPPSLSSSQSTQKSK